MKCITFFIAIWGMGLHSVAQQVQLKGVVSVQNSKTYTGQTQYVKNAEVEHTNPKNAKAKDVTGDDGKFTLKIQGVQSNTQTQIAIVLYGAYSDYVIVNEKELRDITLGRVMPVGVYVCKKGDLEKRQAEMVGINMKKLEERSDADKKRLQKELEDLKANNDYLNARYSTIKDSLDIISKNIDKAFERIKEYAQNMVLENLDNKEDNYIKAYECFSKGELDSVSYYLQDQELELKHQKILQLQEEAKKEKELAAVLTESARAKEEYTENSLHELIKEWLLLARTFNMKNDYEKTTLYYEKAVQADTLNMDNLYEFAKYLHSIREYPKAEQYFMQCLKRYRLLEKENPNAHLADVAKVLNRLGFLHRVVNEHRKSLEEYAEALKIRKDLAKDNTKDNLADLANTLNDFGVLHRAMSEYQQALEKYNEALKIRKDLAKEEPKTYLADVAQTLNNLAVLHWNLKEYEQALEEYNEALEIRRKLAVENPKVYLPDVAQTLNNIAVVHWEVKEYANASDKYAEALKIRRDLAEENPKVYLDKVAQSLENLAILHRATKEYAKSLEEYAEALEINRMLAVENPKAYSRHVARTLDNLALVHLNTKEYGKALEEHEESLKIFRELAKENPKVYLIDVVWTLNNFSEYYLFTKEYAHAEQFAREALALDSTILHGKIYLAHALLFQNRFAEAEKIYQELSKTIYQDKETYAPTILESLDELEKADAIPEARKADVEKIKGMLKE